MEVLAAADKLQLPKLRRACVAFLEQTVNVDNACTILAVSKQLNLVPLLGACTELIFENGEAVLESAGFKQLTKEAVISIISNHKLHATEEEVFEAVMSWGETAVARSSGSCADGVSEAVSDCLPYLRLDEMDHTFLCNRVQQTGLFSAGAVIAAMSKMLDKHNTSNKRSYDNEGNIEVAKKKFRIG